MKNITILIISLVVLSCSFIQEFLPSIERQLTEAPVSLKANVPLNLCTKRPRHRKRNRIGVKISLADSKRIFRNSVTCSNGANFTISVSAQDSAGKTHKLEPLWFSSQYIYFTVRPQPPKDLDFTNIVITSSADTTLQSVVWQQLNIK